MNKWSYCPSVAPYIEQSGAIGEKISSTKGAVELDPLNLNLEPYVIYDSHMGVNLNLGKCFDIDKNEPRSQEEVWNSGLLGILGFTREQFNPLTINATNNGQARVRYDNVREIYNPTTNSQPTSADNEQFIMNPYGAVQYTTQIPFNLMIPNLYYDKAVPLSKKEWGVFPPIVIDTTSIKIEAVDLPKVILKPYLTVRSDIISKTKYIGGSNSGLSMPIIAVINKINAEKDFIQIEGNEIFTITEPTTFSSITTAICDPDGTLALVDDSSCVIYKISKQGDLGDFDILAQIQET